MSDKINEKVINIFSKHKKPVSAHCEEKVCRDEDGYYYVCLKTDLNGKHFDEETLLKRSIECYYIVKVMVKKSISPYPYIYNYKVSGEKIFEFLENFENNEKEGIVIELDKFYPEEWA